MADIVSSLADKLLTAAGTLIVVVLPPVRKFLYRWPLESAIVISTVLSLAFTYMTVIRFAEWPGDQKDLPIGVAAGPPGFEGDGWSPHYPEAFTSTCPDGSYAVGIKWYGLINHSNGDRAAAKIQVVCKPLNTPPKLTIN